MNTTEFLVEADDTLLPFLLAHVKGKSRNAVKNLLARKQVLLDARPVTRFDTPLMPGQKVTLLPAPPRQGPAQELEVLYEDADLLAVNKPAGLLSMANEKEKFRTAYRMATDHVREKDGLGRVFIVHRLDRDTSGVLLFAKDEALKHALQDGWDKLVEKRGYQAVVEGAPPEASGTVRSFLCETSTHLVFSGHEGRGAKEAVTHYAVAARGRGYSLLDIRIDTGRKNQVRVHMKDLGCPVAGDKTYGAKTDPFGRLGLHAGELVLHRPDNGKRLSLTAPLPTEFKRFF